ncbi:50S ribosomal protein L3 [Anoxynatronum buryatiense]|uniref:Large ribosomal subunit protein uL3 n=1 Tax=Anoxynatronum buryatiense TaxID=489973 RepID=A0AA45WZY2_9CLOT|nr:50S ribosomal protein L3 [Anoxynatronum buryatiense]SMP69720.1 large subunit ribosomal protein L3 [Anoxynatronum buryatiense]
MKALMGRKVGMTQVFDELGNVIPVTVIAVETNQVTQIKTKEKEGYTAVQIAFSTTKENRTIKPAKGHFDKAGVAYRKYLRELKVKDPSTYTVGQELNADVFVAGDKVDITGTSKGKGFQGVIKRHNQSRGPMTHGSHYHRNPGSMGASSSPSRVFKGKKLPGQMGSVRVTMQNLEVVRVDAERNAILVKGAVPGPKKGMVFMKEARKTQEK